MSIKVYEAYRVFKGVDPFDLGCELKRQGRQAVKERLRGVFQEILDGASHREALRLQQENDAFNVWLKENHPEDAETPTHKIWSLYREWAENHFPPELKRSWVPPKIAVLNSAILTKAGRDAAEGMKPGVFDIDRWMSECYRDQLGRMERNLWACDVSLTIRKYRNRHYIIPYCESSSILGGVLDFLQHDDRLEDFAYWNNSDPPDNVTSQEWTWRGKVWEDLTEHDRWPDFLTVDIVSWDGWTSVSPALEFARTVGHGKMFPHAEEGT